MIISIGIGTQGALPGSALYAGATCEGIGRFIFNGFNGVDSPENITKKVDLCKPNPRYSHLRQDTQMDLIR